MAANLNIVLATDDETSQYVLVSLSRAITAAYWSVNAGDIAAMTEQIVSTCTMLEDILGKVAHGSILVQVPQSVVNGINILAAAGNSEVYTRWNRLLSYGAISIVSDDTWRALPNMAVSGPAGLAGLGLAPIVLVAIIVICVTIIVTATAIAYALTQISRDAFYARNAWNDCVIANQGIAAKCGDKPPETASPWEALSGVSTAITVAAVAIGGGVLLWFAMPYIKGLWAGHKALTARNEVTP